MAQPLNEEDVHRLLANLEILNMLRKYALAHPELRFGQILRDTCIAQEIRENYAVVGWVNGFYEESDKTLHRVREECGKLSLSFLDK